MRRIFLILLLNLVMISLSNALWFEAPESSITIIENATPLNEASFVIKNVEFTYKGSYKIVEDSTKGYLVVFEAINTSDSKVYLGCRQIGEAYDESKVYTPLDQYSFYILKYDIQFIHNSYPPKKFMLVGFFIPEPPKKLIGIYFLNNYYKWDDKYVLPIENLINKNKEKSETENSILKFRGFPLEKATINDVLEKEGIPLVKQTQNKVVSILYQDRLFERECYVAYLFYNDLLFTGGYIFEFQYNEIDEMSRIFKNIKDILSKKYGKGKLELEGYAKNLVEDLEDEESMMYVFIQALKITISFIVNPQQAVGLRVEGSLDEGAKGIINVMYVDSRIFQKAYGTNESNESEEEAF